VKCTFHTAASREFLEAIDYYESAEPGLGASFYNELIATVVRIEEGPDAWPVLEGEVRRCLTHRFPYGVLYRVEEDSILILAVMHLHRRPDYWKDRL